MKRRIQVNLMIAICAVVLPISKLEPQVAAIAFAPQAPNVCVSQATAQINKVRYLGKNSSHDEIEVEWLAHSLSQCFLFGSGRASEKQTVPPFGYELTVKIKRKLGNEDSATVSKREFINDGTIKTIVRIPRANLETDPVSFVATLKTTAGALLTKRIVVTGNGAPSLAGATQTAASFSTIPGTPSGCYPSLNVSAVNFIPGSGTTPDNVAITWGAGVATTACFDLPRFTVAADVTRPGGHVDKVETVFSPGSSSAQLQFSGVPGPVVSFHVVIEAISGAVLDKTSTQSGNF
jgi:hypothetical protein